eukprot:5203308-Prymnesium_polylepis.2
MSRALVIIPTCLMMLAIAATRTTKAARPGRVKTNMKYCLTTRCSTSSGTSMANMSPPKAHRIEPSIEKGVVTTSHTPQPMLMKRDTLAAPDTNP